jgi:hypothetical protein
VKNQDNYGMKVYFFEFDINMKENNRSNITRERQMLLIRTEKYELWLFLDNILKAAYKFKK